MSAPSLPRQGFILTRHWRDSPAGSAIDLWLATDHGAQKVSLPAQETVAFVPTTFSDRVRTLLAGKDVQLRPLALRDFQRRPVDGLYCRHYRTLARAEKILADAGIPLYEADIRPPERYLMERFITAPDYRPSLSLVSLDIETNRLGSSIVSACTVAASIRFICSGSRAAPPRRTRRCNWNKFLAARALSNG